MTIHIGPPPRPTGSPLWTFAAVVLGVSIGLVCCFVPVWFGYVWLIDTEVPTLLVESLPWLLTPAVYAFVSGCLELWILHRSLPPWRQVAWLLAALVGGGVGGVASALCWAVIRVMHWELNAVVDLALIASLGASTGAMSGTVAGLLQIWSVRAPWATLHWVLWNLLTWATAWSLAWFVGGVIELWSVPPVGDLIALGLGTALTGLSLLLWAHRTPQIEV